VKRRAREVREPIVKDPETGPKKKKKRYRGTLANRLKKKGKCNRYFKRQTVREARPFRTLVKVEGGYVGGEWRVGCKGCFQVRKKRRPYKTKKP